MTIPDLYGQAPLRREQAQVGQDGEPYAIPDLYGQAPLRQGLKGAPEVPLVGSIPDLYGQAPLRPRIPPRFCGRTPSLFLTYTVRLH